jgi:hypothetical protein
MSLWRTVVVLVRSELMDSGTITAISRPAMTATSPARRKAGVVA